jgi:hypothetical protein
MDPFLTLTAAAMSTKTLRLGTGICLVNQRDPIQTLGLPQKWGSGGDRGWRMCIVGGLESLSESGTERAVVDRAANLEQEIGTSSRPSHLLRFVHPAVHQKIGRPLGDRGTHSQSGTVPLGVIDHPIALAGEISIQCVQRGPKFSRGRDGLSHTRLALKMMHHRADAIDADLGVLGLAVPQPPVQPFNLLDDYRLRGHPRRIIGRQAVGCLLQVLESHTDVEPVENRRFCQRSCQQV